MVISSWLHFSHDIMDNNGIYASNKQCNMEGRLKHMVGFIDFDSKADLAGTNDAS